MSTKTLTGIRPSLWARCVTAAIFQGRGAEEAELPPETQEYFERGAIFEEMVMRRVAAKHGKENVERQVPVPIEGIGEGHADGYLRNEKALIEVKSTTAPYPNSDTFQFGVEQLRRYLAYHPEAEQGYLYMIDPNRNRKEDEYVVRLSDDDARGIEAERRAIVHAVRYPDDGLVSHGHDYRPCTRPSQARGRLCPFAHVCFSDWTPPAPTEIPDPVALEVVSRLHAIKEEKRRHTAAAKALEEGEKQAQAELADLVDEGDSLVGPFAVKRTHVRRSPVFSVKAFEAAGHSVEPLAEFFRPGSEYDLFRIDRAEDAGDIDFGDEAPF